MSKYRVQYTNNALTGYNALSASTRKAFDAAVDSMSYSPRNHGSAIRGNPDRRSATLAGVITEYEVSSGVLVVTMLHVRGL
ncbi:hypothetical protein [Streptomyces sp. SID3343]|uniref:hypothetical protein n=1 Tax=Streptomyces sp. SID3343 TaxID=2690260 RepID=UPI0013688D15|nr:hypothetical protein [Streptomyces sp. SID3343]MYW05244.1 hypothetical protein [Streptomyces sp. SID3343]